MDNCQEKSFNASFQLPSGKMKPIGYTCQQHGVRLERPVKALDKWVKRIPDVYREYVLNDESVNGIVDEEQCLATVKHYRSLIPMAQEHRKPIFKLTSADGAIGAHAHAVQDAKSDFRQLASKIADKMSMRIETY